MAKFGKWIGGGLGWALGGPLGGLFGFFVGSMFDSVQTETTRRPGLTTTGDFAMSMLVLVAAVMRADGKVMRSELDFVKAYFVRNFGRDAAGEAMLMLRDLLNKKIPLNDVTRQIKNRMDYSSRLQLLHFLYGISMADSVISDKEMNIIEIIAGNLDITEKDRESIKSMFIEKNGGAAYRILEVEPSATDEEVKKAYRKMANKYHPDKVSYLGEDFRKIAHEKFQKVNEAYDRIKKERGGMN